MSEQYLMVVGKGTSAIQALADYHDNMTKATAEGYRLAADPFHVFDASGTATRVGQHLICCQMVMFDDLPDKSTQIIEEMATNIAKLQDEVRDKTRRIDHLFHEYKAATEEIDRLNNDQKAYLELAEQTNRKPKPGEPAWAVLAELIANLSREKRELQHVLVRMRQPSLSEQYTEQITKALEEGRILYNTDEIRRALDKESRPKETHEQKTDEAN